MKNKFIALILVAVMLIPTVIAIVNYSKQQSGTADSRNTEKITLVDPKDNEYVFTRKNGSDMLDYFLDAIDSATFVDKLPTTIEIGSFYRVTIATTVKEMAYKFYYTSLASDCYFVDGTDGKAYRIDEKDAEKFLTCSYAMVMYENGTLPVLTVSDRTVSPKSATWNVKVGEKTVSADTKGIVSEEVPEITTVGGLSLSFSLKPDSFALTVIDSDSNEVYFEGAYDETTVLPLKTDMNVRIEGSAKWYEDPERNYSGEQSFVFNAKVGAPAEFYAGVTELEIGEFLCVTGLNVVNPDDIRFSSEPAINYTPKFFGDGSRADALIPFSWDLAAGTYVLSFTYGGTSQNINITLKNRDPSHPFRDNLTKTYPKSYIDTYASDASIKAAEDGLLPVAKSTEYASSILWEGSFVEGVNGTFTAGFGNTFSVSDSDMSFRHTGVDYAAVGADVVAVNNGTVVYKGLFDYCGWVVVVEHGLGLKSWYCHLGSADVEIGQSVTKGQKLGVTGNSSFIPEEGAHVGLTVFDVPVCQYTLWSDGYNKGIPVYSK